jgi:hypothetical protein
VNPQRVTVAEYVETEKAADKVLTQHGEWYIVSVPTKAAAKVATTAR